MAGYIVRDEQGRIVPGVAWVAERLKARMPRMLKEMSVALLTLIQHGFERERSPDGTPWEQLRPATVRQRGSAHPILRHQGDLFRSLQPGAGASSAFVGTNWPYARVHQFGGRIKRKGGTTTLYFKLGRDGLPGRRFVRRKDSNFAMEAKVNAYEIPIPARPYLFTAEGRIPPAWQERMKSIVLRHITENS